MFTGIIETIGQIERTGAGDDGGRSLWIRSEFESLELGESIATGGVCLTVAELNGASFRVDAGPETLERRSQKPSHAIVRQDQTRAHRTQHHRGAFGVFVETRRPTPLPPPAIGETAARSSAMRGPSAHVPNPPIEWPVK